MKDAKIFLLVAQWVFVNYPMFSQTHHSLVIHEIMADPSPAVQLPAYEWIEIKNNSKEPIQLLGWKLVVGTSVSGSFPTYLLLPDSLLIICSSSAAMAMKNYGNTLAIASFPLLSNEGETISIRAPNGRTNHAVTYSPILYGSAWKQEGGWSLEMIDSRYPCWSPDNWLASIDNKGGTPGRINSHTGTSIIPATIKPTRAYAIDSTTIAVVFNRPLDSASSVQVSNYVFNNAYSPKQIRVAAPSYTQAIVLLDKPLLPDTIIKIDIKNIVDCEGGKMSESIPVYTGLASTAQKSLLYFNEILFNPRPNAYDFIEIGNKSKQLIDLSTLLISSRNSAGMMGTAYKIAETPLLLFPGELLAFTEDTFSLKREYLISLLAKIAEVKQLPLLPDEEGTLVLLNIHGEIIDELHYYDSWHFPLLQSTEGVSLERIDRDASTNTPTNWHSAASTEGFATPGRKNSQEKLDLTPTAEYEVVPGVFSPDGDGWQDYCQLLYKTNQNGLMASITVVDAAGRTVRQLIPQALLATAGYFTWNGNNEQGQVCPPGAYLFIIQQFDLKGKTKTLRVPIVLTTSFRKV